MHTVMWNGPLERVTDQTREKQRERVEGLVVERQLHPTAPQRTKTKRP